MLTTGGRVLSVCDPGDHEWEDKEENDDGTKWQECSKCGKRRRVSADTPES